MKWYWIVLIVLAVGAMCFGAGFVTEFMISPMDEPLCVVRGSDAIERAIAALDPTHQGWYWFAIVGAFGLPFVGLFSWIAISLDRIANAKAASN